MAGEKILGFRIEVRGTEKQTSQMNKLTIETERMREAIRKLNKIGRDNKGLTDAQILQRKKLTNQIAANNKAYKQLNNSIVKNSGVTKKNTSFTAKMGKSIVAAGAAMIGVTAVIGLVTRAISGAIKIFVEYQKANSKLQAVLRATEDEMSSLKDQSKELGSTTAFTASEVVQLQTEYAKLGFPTDKILEMTEATLNGAAALGSELGEQAALTGALLKQYGLEANQAARVNDVLAESAASSALDFSKLSTALPIVGATANAVGVSLEKTTALLGTLADRGLDASTSGTSLRNVFLELSKQGLTFQEAMIKINGSSDKAATSMALFGKRGATAGLILAETGEQVENLEEKLLDAEGAARIMAETMLDNVAGDVTKAKSAYEGFILSIEDGDGAISRAIRKYTQLSTVLLGFFTDLNNGKGFMDSWNDALTEGVKATGGLESQAKILGVAQEDLVEVVRDNEEAYTVMFQKMTDGEITIKQFRSGIAKLADGFADAEPSSRRLQLQLDILKKRFEDGEISATSFKFAMEKLKVQIVDVAKAESDARKESSEKAIKDRENAAIEAAEKEAAIIAAARLEQEEADKKAREKAAKKAIKDAEKLAKEIEALRAKGESDGNKFLLKQREKLINDQLKLQEKQINLEFDRKIAAIQGDGDEETKLIIDLELKRLASLAELREKERQLKREELDQDVKDRLSAITGDSEKENQLRLSIIAQQRLARQELENEFKLVDDELKLEADALEVENAATQQEKIEKAKQEQRDFGISSAQKAIQLFSAFQQQAADRNLIKVQKNTKKEIQALQDQLDAGLISQEVFDSKKEKIEEKARKKESKIKKDAFEKGKAASIIQAIIAAALGVVKASPVIPLMIAAGVAGAAQVALIAGQPTPEFAEGGLVEGSSHSQGGIQMYHKNGSHLGEMEGDEYIFSKDSTNRIGVDNLDAMNFGGASPSLNGFFAHGGSVPSSGSIPSVSNALTSQQNLDAFSSAVAAQMQDAIAEIVVRNDATETFDTALEVRNQEATLNFG